MDLDGRRLTCAAAIPWFIAVLCCGASLMGLPAVRADERLLENEFLEGPPNTLVRADKFLANGQAADAIQVLRQVMEENPKEDEKIVEELMKEQQQQETMSGDVSPSWDAAGQ